MSGFAHADLAELARLLRDAARAEVMPRFRRLGAEAVRQKSGPLDYVTDADEAAEVMISAGLRAHFPGCVIVGEEGASADPSLLGRLGGDGLVFVVDPIDGTFNFVAGLPLFGTMAAAIVDGEIVGAAIHDPVCDDTALALRGEGAWLETADGVRTRLRVTAGDTAQRMAGAVSWRGLDEPLRSRVSRNLPRVGQSYEYRCGAHHYRMAASGFCHFLLFSHLVPWDHAPGWLLHAEAGGYSARLDGTPYRPDETKGGMISAPDRASWEALRDALLS